MPDNDRLRTEIKHIMHSHGAAQEAVDAMLALIAREVRLGKIEELKISANRLMPGWEKDWFNDRIAELSKELSR